MTHHNVEIDDKVEASAEARPEANPEPRFPYEVISEAGLFKNGRHYNAGDVIELTRETGNNFINAGDVKEVKQESENE